MRKILFIFILLTFVLGGNVKALTLSDTEYITQKNIQLTKEEYEKLKSITSEKIINRFDSNIVNVLTSNNTIVTRDVVYVVTTTNYDIKGNIISEKSIITTKKKALEVAKNSSLYVDKDGIIKTQFTTEKSSNSYVSTTSKEVEIEYYIDSEGYVVHLNANWFSLPKIRVFDVMAARWTNSINSNDLTIYGCQESDEKTTFYDISSGNIKKTSNGLGLSMNLHNNASSYLSLELFIYSPNNLGSHVYGTYQHARHSNATLEISKSYTFSSSGLGGVLYYSNSTYRSYYDGMQGVSV